MIAMDFRIASLLLIILRILGQLTPIELCRSFINLLVTSRFN
jgi:hypothetical protein